MPSQRARDAEIRVRNTLANGPRRVQSKALAEYSATFGQALMPRICQYPESARLAVNQGGTADKTLGFVRPWRKGSFCQGRFLFAPLAK